jgi:hypothetical protein
LSSASVGGFEPSKPNQTHERLGIVFQFVEFLKGDAEVGPEFLSGAGLGSIEIDSRQLTVPCCVELWLFHGSPHAYRFW